MEDVDIPYEEQDDDIRKARDGAMKSAAHIFNRQDINGDGVMDMREV